MRLTELVVVRHSTIHSILYVESGHNSARLSSVHGVGVVGEYVSESRMCNLCEWQRISFSTHEFIILMTRAPTHEETTHAQLTDTESAHVEAIVLLRGHLKHAAFPVRGCLRMS